MKIELSDDAASDDETSAHVLGLLVDYYFDVYMHGGQLLHGRLQAVTDGILFLRYVDFNGQSLDSAMIPVGCIDKVVYTSSLDLGKCLLDNAPYGVVPLEDARKRWIAQRVFLGLSAKAVPLFTAPDGNMKLEKALKHNVHVYGLALAAHSGSGVNVCRFSTPECRRGCLQYAGRNQGSNAQNAQIARTMFLANDPEAFQTLLIDETRRYWKKHGSALRIRLNVLSDLPFERIFPLWFEAFSTVKTYDYTKWSFDKRGNNVPKNLHLTYSASEKWTDEKIGSYVGNGLNVAVVFDTKRGEALPTSYNGWKVIDGDESDDRTRDPKGVIVGLRAKGPMRKTPGQMVRKVA